jgi:hypothetical protein
MSVERAPASEEDDLEIVEVKRMRGPQVVEGRWKPADKQRRRGGKIQSGTLEDESHQKAGWVEKLARPRAERDGNEGNEEGSGGGWIPDTPSARSPIHALGDNDSENTLKEE